MSTALVQSTQVAVTLSLNVIKNDDRGVNMFVPLVINLTPVVFILWDWLESLSRTYLSLVELNTVSIQLLEAAVMVASIYLTWFEIVARSLAWGLVGLRL